MEMVGRTIQLIASFQRISNFCQEQRQCQENLCHTNIFLKAECHLWVWQAQLAQSISNLVLQKD